MKSFRSITYLLIVILACSSSLLAQDEPKNGRTADGRAYRTDKEGNQLIDYIAELELEVDGLSRRVHGLEDESDQKQKVIDRLSKGAPVEGELTERNLVGGPASQKLQAHVVTESARTEPDQQLSSEISSLKQELAQERATHQQTVVRYEDRISKLSGDIESVKSGKATAAQATDLERIRALEAARDELDLVRRTHRDEVAKLNSHLEKVQQQFAASQENFETVKAKYDALASRHTEVLAAQAQLERNHDRNEAIQRTKSVVERTEQEEPARTATYSVDESRDRSEERASLSPARLRALDSVRGRINTDMNSLGGKISTRNRLFASYRGSQVQLKPQSTLSSKNESLDQLRRRTQSASNVTELSYIAREVSLIKNRVDDDLALISRMNKAG